MTKQDYTVPALRRGLDILELFGREQYRLSQNEIAEGLGLPVHSVYRFVQTLLAGGYLERSRDGRYALGSRMVAQGFSYFSSRDLVEIAAEPVSDLCARTSLSSHLSIREERDVLYIYRALAQQRVAVNVPVGTRLPCHTTAMGRALLSGVDTQTLKMLYAHQNLDGYAAPSPSTFPQLIDMIAEESDRGWHTSGSDESTAVAVPIRNPVGDVVAAINVAGPDPVMHRPGMFEELATELTASALVIGNQLSN
jgi:DNA-binding IclR family transcriptional regulator